MSFGFTIMTIPLKKKKPEVSHFHTSQKTSLSPLRMCNGDFFFLKRFTDYHGDMMEGFFFLVCFLLVTIYNFTHTTPWCAMIVQYLQSVSRKTSIFPSSLKRNNGPIFPERKLYNLTKTALPGHCLKLHEDNCALTLMGNNCMADALKAVGIYNPNFC